MMSYTGYLTGTGEMITSSARYIVYDHKSGLIYLSTGDRQLALEVLRRQRRRERHGDYNAYELVDGSWCEIESRLARRRCDITTLSSALCGERASQSR